MHRQIEIETRHSQEAPLGDIPCYFGTLTSQRYQWDGIISKIAQVEGIEDYMALSKGKRRELVNKYPLFVAFYCSVRLELVLKTVVVPYCRAHNYLAVYEWSPTGAMVHVHYVLWVSGAPRFDERAKLMERMAAEAKKEGWGSTNPTLCKIDDVVNFFSKHIVEWNVNKNAKGEELVCRVAETVNETKPHTASYTARDMLTLLQDDKKEERHDYYARAVRTEHMHDYHHPDPLGPPNPSQSCAQLLKGTSNMWYCRSGYPHDMVCDVCHQSVSQDALRPELWRVCLMRNCPLMNSHLPLATIATQSNTDVAGVLTALQSELYLCKYCTKHSKRKGQRNILYEVMDDMAHKDVHGREAHGEEFEATKLGSKLHRAFMAEVGEEVSQPEVAHHANRSPEYLCSRPSKEVHFYKKALALPSQINTEPTVAKSNAGAKARKTLRRVSSGGDAEGHLDPTKPIATSISDLALYESRTSYRFAEDAGLSDALPPASTPEEQVAAASAWDFFRLVRFHGGKNPWLEWYGIHERPIVLISPTFKLTIGADFAFGTRWALMLYHAWTDRNEFLGMSDSDIQKYFHTWIKSDSCPWYILEQYIDENHLSRRGGAGRCESAVSKSSSFQDDSKEGSMEEAESPLSGDEPREEVPPSDTEHGSSDDQQKQESRVLKMLYKGNVQEMSCQEERARKGKVFNTKHSFYRHTRCTSIAQEESSALPAGVFNINEDSDDDEAYIGEENEIRQEMDELRAANKWINQEGWDVEAEAHATSTKSGKDMNLRSLCSPKVTILRQRCNCFLATCN